MLAAFTSIAVPTAASGPNGITVAAEGNVWFTEIDQNKLGRIQPGSNKVDPEVGISPPPSRPSGILATPDNTLWVTFEGAGTPGNPASVGHFTATGAPISAPGAANGIVTLPSVNARPGAIALGPDGSSVWFVEPSVNRIGKVTAGLVASESPALPAGLTPTGIVSGADNNSLWVTAFGTAGDVILKLDASGAVIDSTTFGAGSRPSDVARGDDGNLWVTLSGTNRIARVSAANPGTFSEFAIPSQGSPTAIARGGDGAFWFTESTGLVGRVNATGMITEFNPSLNLGALNDIAADGKNLWITAKGANRIVHLDATQLITVTPRSLTARPNVPLTQAVVATFAADGRTTTAADFSATIDWGDGSPTDILGPSNIRAAASGGYEVVASHAYARAGTFPTKIVVSDQAGLASPQASGSVVASNFAIQIAGQAFTAGQNQAITQVVANFTTDQANAAPANFTAAINWGDGSINTQGTITASPAGGFQVSGSHVYASAGTFPLAVTIRDNTTQAFVTSTAVSVTVSAAAAAPPLPIGPAFRLAPSSDSGASNSDNITNVNRPVFVGSAVKNASGGVSLTGQAYAVVQLYAQRADSWPSESRYLGQAIVNANGEWSVASSFLPDGIYTVTAVQTPPGGTPSLPTVMSGADGLPAALVIDTTAPRVSGFAASPRENVVTAVISDVGAGILSTNDQSAIAFYRGSVLNPANFTVVPPQTLAGYGGASGGVRPALAPSVSGFYSAASAVTVRVDFSGSSPIWPRHQRWVFQVSSGGVSDLAGNALDGEFTGRLPSGNGAPGGNFIAKLTQPRAASRPGLAFRSNRFRPR